MLLAQALDSLSGGGGWVGAGLLGAVLMWLFFKHLPSKDAQITALIERKDLHVENLQAEFTQALDKMAAVYREESKAERLACETHFATLANSMNQAFKTLGDQLQSHSQRNQQWIDLLRNEVDVKRRELAAKEATGT